MARLSVILLIALAPVSAGAAQIVVDVDRGIVLAADAPDAARRPASLVKLMTAYVAFAALESGDMTEDQIITVSKHAARQPPVKLRVKAGRELPFGELLAAAVIGSKNDAATAVAEAVAGDEDRFAARMNETAARLGMTNTRYINASGLPAAGQRTTARDTALLAVALLTDFPARSTLFSERKTRAAGRAVTTTNPLFGRVPGALGMKTGFTCGAGYNIAGLIARDGRRVLAVTLGHRTKGGRLTAVRSLIDKGFAVQEAGTPLEAARATSPEPPPHIGACSGKAVAAVRANDAWIPPERPKPARSVPAPARRVVILPRPTPPPPSPPPAAPRRPPPPPPLSGWGAFFGAFPGDREAAARLAAINALATKSRILPSKIIPRARDGRHLGVIHGLDKAQAQAICAIAKGIGQYCLTLAPQVLLNPRARWRR